jgi:hypothetical protein
MPSVREKALRAPREGALRLAALARLPDRRLALFAPVLNLFREFVEAL